MPPGGDMPLGPVEPVYTPYLTEALCLQFATDDPQVWFKRNERIVRHRRLYELQKPRREKVKEGQVVAVTNDGKAIPKKMASMLANHVPTIEVVCRDEQNKWVAEMAENALLWYREEENDRFGQGPNGDRSFTESEYMLRDGMIVDFTTPDMDPEFPWYSCLADPITCSPSYRGDRLIRCTQKIRTSLGDVRGILETYAKQLEDLDQGYAGKKDNSPVELTKVFAQRPTDKQWELALLLQGKLLVVEPIGYNPVTITYAAGRAYGLEANEFYNEVDRYENIGVGIFDTIEEPLREKNKTYSLLKSQLAQKENPPVALFTDNDNVIDQLPIKAGAPMVFAPADKFQVIETGPDNGLMQGVLEMETTSLERGSIPRPLWGEAAGNTGNQDFMLLGSARDMVFIYTRAMERFYAAKYRKVLELFRDYGTQPVYVSVFSKMGITLGGKTLDPQALQALGTIQVKVRYGDITPQNENMRANTAATLTDKMILDLDSAREYGLPAPYNQHPELIGQRVLADLALRHPMITQMNALAAAMTSPNELIRTMANMLFEQQMQQFMAQLTTPGGGMTPNGGGGPAGPPGAAPDASQAAGQPPAPNDHPAPSVAPPEQGQTAGLPDNYRPAGGTPSQPGI